MECADGTLYTGITTNLLRRLKQHNGQIAGGAKYTRSRAPVVIRYCELHPNRTAAAKREYAIKQLTKIQKNRLIHPVIA